ncbi:MAG: hypothetical protein D6705_07400 [Deltaproteobacteria bacterium]|nr:MAG: hypothetical protein D6705_07400 [Deltaproteobacteria bacterium]
MLRTRVRTLGTVLAATFLLSACKKEAPEDAPQTVTLPGPKDAAKAGTGSGAGGEADAPEDGEDLPDAETLLAKVVDAVGGADRIEAITSFYEEAQVESPKQNLRGTVRMWWQKGDFYAETDLPGVGLTRQGKKGETVWSEDPIFGPRVLSGPEAEQTKWQAKLTLAHRWRDFFDRARTVAKRTEGDRTIYDVELVKDPDTKVVLHVDANTYEVVSETLEQASPMGKVPVTVRFFDVREVAGVKMPYRIELDTPLGKMIHTVTKIEVGVPVDPAKFEVPTAPAGVPAAPKLPANGTPALPGAGPNGAPSVPSPEARPDATAH